MIEIEPKNTRGWPKTKQQYDLCQLLVVEGLNHTDAGRKVGYAASTVDRNMSTIVKRLSPYIAHLREAKKEVIERNWEVTVDRVVDELTNIGFVNPKDYVRVVTHDKVPMVIGKALTDLTDSQARAVVDWDRTKVETDDGHAWDYRYKFYDKRQSLRDMGQHLGMFNEKLILEQRITKTYKVDLSQVPDEMLEEWMAKLKEHGGQLPDQSGPATIDHDTGAVT